MFVVTITNGAYEYPLRGTVWAFDMSRAQTFATREEAQAALDKARKFMKPAMFKRAVIKADPREEAFQEYFWNLNAADQGFAVDEDTARAMYARR